MLSLMFPAPHRTHEIEPSMTGPSVWGSAEASARPFSNLRLRQECERLTRNIAIENGHVALRCEFFQKLVSVSKKKWRPGSGTSKIVSKGICAEIYAANLWWTCARCASVSLWAFAFLSCTPQKTHLQQDFTFFHVLHFWIKMNLPFISQLSFHCHDLKLKPWQRKRFLLDLWRWSPKIWPLEPETMIACDYFCNVDIQHLLAPNLNMLGKTSGCSRTHSDHHDFWHIEYPEEALRWCRFISNHPGRCMHSAVKQFILRYSSWNMIQIPAPKYDKNHSSGTVQQIMWDILLKGQMVTFPTWAVHQTLGLMGRIIAHCGNPYLGVNQ